MNISFYIIYIRILVLANIHDNMWTHAVSSQSPLHQ